MKLNIWKIIFVLETLFLIECEGLNLIDRELIIYDRDLPEMVTIKSDVTLFCDSGLVQYLYGYYALEILNVYTQNGLIEPSVVEYPWSRDDFDKTIIFDYTLSYLLYIGESIFSLEVKGDAVMKKRWPIPLYCEYLVLNLKVRYPHVTTSTQKTVFLVDGRYLKKEYNNDVNMLLEDIKESF